MEAAAEVFQGAARLTLRPPGCRSTFSAQNSEPGRHIGKDPDAGKRLRAFEEIEEKGATEDEMVSWHH